MARPRVRQLWLFDVRVEADDGTMPETYRLAVHDVTEHAALMRATRVASVRWRKAHTWSAFGTLAAERVAREYEVVGMR